MRMENYGDMMAITGKSFGNILKSCISMRSIGWELLTKNMHTATDKRTGSHLLIASCSSDVVTLTISCDIYDWARWLETFNITFVTVDGGEHWEITDFYPHLFSPYFEGDEGVTLSYYVTHDGGRTWEYDEELAHYYQQLWKRATLMRAARFIDRFTRTDGMRENAIKP